MSNFSFAGDLLKFIGSDVCSLNYKGKMRNCIIIPVDWNDIKVVVDDKNKPISAPFYGRNWEVNKAYIEACMRKHDGDPNYKAPSHTMNLVWSEEFMNKAVDSAYNRMKGDPQNEGISDEELKKKALYEIRNKLRFGSMKVLASREQPTLQGDASPLQEDPQEYAQEVDAKDDLPF